MSDPHDPVLPLSADEVLLTTRAVRKRLDLTRPVERSVVEACLRIAQQAPSSSNRQQWHFVVVTDPKRRAALAELYRRSYSAYRTRRVAPAGLDESRAATQQRVYSSADYLADHLHEVPVLVVPCIEGRPEGQPYAAQAGHWGTILPAAWSFMLAARARGLGTAWTTLHLAYEQEAADLLGIPYEQVSQAALIPVAYTLGTEFGQAPRAPLASMVHWESW